MMYARDFREKAREALAGNWGVAVGTGLMAALLGAATTMTGSNSGNAQIQFNDGSISEAAKTGVYFDGVDNYVLNELQIAIFAIMAAVLTAVFVISLIRFIISGATTLGYAKFNLKLIDGEPAAFATLFSGYKRFGTGLAMQLLRAIYTALWTLLFIIPGIMACYSYAMAPYILVDHPEMSAKEAIRRSKEIMYGNRWRLFCMQFSFIGWNLLCAMFTLGIGYLWLIPYMEAANAAFYREINGVPVKAEEPKDEYDDSYRYRDVSAE